MTTAESLKKAALRFARSFVCWLRGGHKFHWYSKEEDVPWIFGGGIIFHKLGGWACTKCGAEFVVPAPSPDEALAAKGEKP